MKRSLLFLFLSLSALAASAQIIHVKGVKSVEAGYGISKYGALYQAGYVNYFNNRFYGKVNAFYEQGKVKTENAVQGNALDISYTSLGLDLTAAYTVLTANEKLYFNAIAGGTFSVDQLKKNASYSMPTSVKTGAFIGAESEIFITHKFVFIVNYSQRILLGNNFGNTRWFAQGGIRYNF